jgi:Rrf2 family protein
MKISTKGTYGLEAVVDMVLHTSAGGHVSLKDIALRTGVSEAYMLQIFMILKKAQVVTSVRGAKGGYMLARDASKVTVGEVLRALEGPFAPVECVEKNTQKPCARFDICVTKSVWAGIMDALDHLTDSITIEDLITKCSADELKKEILDYYL